MVVPVQCYERVVRVETPDGTGSGFLIDHRDQQWLVTAQHVIDGTALTDVQVIHHTGQKDLALTPIPAVCPGADIAVFRLAERVVSKDLTLVASGDGATLAQDAFLLGYPLGLGMRSAGGEKFPFVKKGIFSGSATGPDRTHVWWLDALGNPGFSGGPVVFNKLGTRDWHVAAVIVSYHVESTRVEGTARGMVPMNAGILYGHDIGHACDAINAFAD